MPNERSCGAVVFRRSEDAERLYLLLHYPGGHWDFPKGKQEVGEDDLTTTRREIQEETAITDLTPIGEFRERIEYYYRRGGQTFHKEVYFILMETSEEHVTLSHEHQGSAWLAYEEALQRLTFDNAKNVLKKAHRFLQKRL